jgi:hypothetical protein
MNFEHLITIISLLTTSILSIYTIHIQSEKKRLKEIEEENKKIKNQFLTALHSIQGYQDYIKDISMEKEVNLETLKAEIHSSKKDYFKSTRFLQPNNINELINKYK